jgi:hypothetical protein
MVDIYEVSEVSEGSEVKEVKQVKWHNQQQPNLGSFMSDRGRGKILQLFPNFPTRRCVFTKSLSKRENHGKPHVHHGVDHGDNQCSS